MRVFFDGPNAFFARAFNVAEQNKPLFALDVSTSDDLISIKRLNVKVNDIGRNPITTEISHSYRPELLGKNKQINDFYITADEQKIYAINPTSEWISFDGTTFIDNGVTIYSANSTSEWASYDGTIYTYNGRLQGNANVQTFNSTTDSSNKSYFYRFDPILGITYSKYNAAQVELWSEVIADGSAEGYLLTAYQRVLIYDAETSTLKLRSHP
jgi:hypothetical protein